MARVLLVLTLIVSVPGLVLATFDADLACATDRDGAPTTAHRANAGCPDHLTMHDSGQTHARGHCPCCKAGSVFPPVAWVTGGKPESGAALVAIAAQAFTDHSFPAHWRPPRHP